MLTVKYIFIMVTQQTGGKDRGRTDSFGQAIWNVQNNRSGRNSLREIGVWEAGALGRQVLMRWLHLALWEGTSEARKGAFSCISSVGREGLGKRVAK